MVGRHWPRVRVVSHPWLKVVGMPIGILVMYFVVPVNAERAPVGVLVGIVLSAVALAGVVIVIVKEVRRAQHRLSALHLVLALEITVVVFSFVYYMIAINDPTEFDGIVTRLDAIYFSTTTVATVGFGDINATGQLARGLVTLNMVFNLVFIAALVNLVKDRMSERREAFQATEQLPDPPNPDA